MIVNYFLSMFWLLAISAAVLMAGILMSGHLEKNLHGAWRDSWMWGIAFVVSFGAEFIAMWFI